jgi:hypothetical protein
LEHAQGQDKIYFEAIFGALTSLGALYLEDEELSNDHYNLARHSLNLLKSEPPRLEALFSHIILVLPGSTRPLTLI